MTTPNFEQEADYLVVLSRQDRMSALMLKAEIAQALRAAYEKGFEAAKEVVTKEAARIAKVYLETAGMRPKGLENAILELRNLTPTNTDKTEGK